MLLGSSSSSNPLRYVRLIPALSTSPCSTNLRSIGSTPIMKRSETAYSPSSKRVKTADGLSSIRKSSSNKPPHKDHTQSVAAKRDELLFATTLLLYCVRRFIFPSSRKSGGSAALFNSSVFQALLFQTSCPQYSFP